MYFALALILKSHIFIRRDWFPLLIRPITWCHRSYTMPGTGRVHSSFHFYSFLSWWQLCCFALDKIVEHGDGKNKSVAKNPHSDPFIFLIHSAGICLRYIFPYVVLLHFNSSTRFPTVFLRKKHSKGSLRSGNNFIYVAYIWHFCIFF